MSSITHSTKTRIIADILLLGLVFVAPWWLILLASLFLLFFYENYFEVLFVGLIFDSLYAIPLARFHSYTYLATCAAVILFLIGTYARKRLIFYFR